MSMSLRVCSCLRLSEFADVCCYVLDRDPMSQMAEERQEHNNKMKKMEAEMEQVFEMKVKEKRQKLKDSEADVSSTFIVSK